MPGSTPTYGFPYPIDTDALDIAGDMQLLAQAVDAAVAAQIAAVNASITSQIAAVNARVAVLEGRVNNHDGYIQFLNDNRPDLVLNAIPFGDKVRTQASAVVTSTDVNGVGYVWYRADQGGQFSNGPYVVCNDAVGSPVVYATLVQQNTGSYFQFQARFNDAGGPVVANSTVAVNYIAVGTRP